MKTTYENRSLIQGLPRNTIFNLIGWMFPLILSFASTPYIVARLGNDAYGIFGIVIIVTGYLGLLNGPVVMGNVRFMAEAFSQENWEEFRKYASMGLVVNGILSLLGGLIMFLAAGLFTVRVFRIPAELVAIATLSFQLAAISFFLNGIVGSLKGIPIAMRRYDILNLIGLISGTLNVVFIITALWLGWGLLGAVAAQVISSALALFFFFIAYRYILSKIVGSWQKQIINLGFIKRLFSFSALLFAGQLTSNIGLQIDRTLIGITLGTSAMTFYLVPAKLTDKIPEMMSSFSTTLYPLSSEAAVTNRIDDLLRLYHNMVRILFLTSGLLGTVIMVSSKGILMVWMGAEFMSRSWLVLVFLAAGAIWRSSGTVAYQVCNGLGRADINLYGSIGTAVLITVPVILLAPLFGTVGIALGLFLGLLVSNLLYDIYTQRKLLGCKSWKAILLPYGRIFIVEVITFVIINFIQLEVSIWITLPLKIVLTSLLFICMSYMMGALQVKDINFIIDKISILLKRLSRNKKDTIHMKA